MSETKEKVVSIDDLFTGILKHKIVILVITVLFLILGVLTTFIYNGKRQQYVVGFIYSDNNLNNGSYFDGSEFYHKSLTTLDTLNSIKEKNEAFSNIDVSLMLKQNGINLEKKESINETTSEKTISFSLVAKTKYFSSREQAVNFLGKVASYPIEKNLSMIESSNYMSNLSSYKNSNTYELQVQYLENQYKLLLGKYDALISNFGNKQMSSASLSDTKDKLILYFTNNSFDLLTFELETNCYVKDYAIYEFELETQKSHLQKEQLLNENKIVALSAERKFIIDSIQNTGTITSLEISSLNSCIQDLLLRNQEIQYDLDIIEKKLDNKDLKDSTFINKKNNFETRLGSYNEQLVSFTEEYSALEKSVISENYHVFYDTNEVATVQGGFNVYIAGTASLVLGVVFGSIVSLLLNKFLKPKKELDIVDQTLQN